ncbi:alpha/beta hydrolase fold domain-containing protein [Pararoseomonas indoligenes]|uniref:Alpha/beta hydrolase fold domain-containing protein n=1 Tax=Roseomonas indoligenes TaxID=2820811 RepID=A0A940MV97_9PROT|nr:alpha/beta hydrolase fold domain-containing protein [Pararoseomonas indoligenes]MBP0491595.1 alpha/beta hydrolase fold domain-containing protein [Pararoseomonas indoligenes]
MKPVATLAALLLSSTALAQGTSPAPAPEPPPPVAAQQPPSLGERLGDATRAIAGNPAANATRDMLRVLAALNDLKPKPIADLSPEEARRQPGAADAVQELLRRNNQPPAPSLGVAARDITLPGPGGAVAARVYTPDGPVAGGGGVARPVILYLHGGGFVIADLNTYDATPRALSHLTGAIAVAVHYRQAPENRFPAAHDDAFAAYRWVVANAASFGGDSRRVAVVGESAGGNLAANVAIAARDAGVQPPVAQVLVYPMAGVDMNTESYRENANAQPLNRAMMAWFMGHYLRNDSDKADPRVDLVGRANLAGLPPATVVTAGIDPLRSDGQALAEKLRQAGVPVASRNYPGVTHEFFGMGTVVQSAANAEAYVAARLGSAFGTRRPELPPSGPARRLGIAARIELGMEVAGADGGVIGTIDYLDGTRMILGKDGTAPDAKNHALELDSVAAVEGGRVQLTVPAEQARRNWRVVD